MNGRLRNIYRKKISRFLRVFNSKELLIFLLFVGLSLLFWTAQALQDDFEIEYHIPIEVIGMPESAVITSDLPDYISVIVKDKGTMLFARQKGSTITPFTINYKDYIPEKGHFSIPAATMLEAVKKQFPPTHQIVSMMPDGLSVFVSNGHSKEFNVELRGKFIPSINCVLSGNVSYEPKRIKVFAPQSIIDSIETIRTEYAEIDNLKDTVEVMLRLQPIQGAKFSKQEIKVMIPVEEFTERSIEVPIVGLNLPSYLRLRAFPPKAKVSFFVGLSKFSHIPDSLFRVTADCRYIADNPKSQTIPVRLDRVPDFVSNVHIEPDSIEYVFEEIYTYD